MMILNCYLKSLVIINDYFLVFAYVFGKKMK